MSRPDFQRLRRNMDVLYTGAGNDFVLRQYVRSSAGAGGLFGYEDQPQYVTRTVIGLFQRYSPAEIQRMGGQLQGSDLFVTTDFPLSTLDELIWDGSVYRVAGNVDKQDFGNNHVSYHSPLKLVTTFIAPVPPNIYPDVGAGISPYVSTGSDLLDQLTVYAEAGSGISPHVSTGIEIYVPPPPWYLSSGITLGQCVAAYQPKGAADLASSKTNLAHPGTNDAAAGVDPSFASATGWTGNGTTQFLTTGIVIPMNLDYTMLVRVSGVASDGARADATGAGWFEIRANWFTQHGYRNGNVTGTANLGSAVTSGVMGVTKSGGYLNGSLDTSITSDNTASGTQWTIFLLKDGPGGLFLKGNILAAAVYNITLSDAQILAVSNAMAAL